MWWSLPQETTKELNGFSYPFFKYMPTAIQKISAWVYCDKEGHWISWRETLELSWDQLKPTQSGSHKCLPDLPSFITWGISGDHSSSSYWPSPTALKFRWVKPSQSESHKCPPDLPSCARWGIPRDHLSSCWPSPTALKFRWVPVFS